LFILFFSQSTILSTFLIKSSSTTHVLVLVSFSISFLSESKLKKSLISCIKLQVFDSSFSSSIISFITFFSNLTSSISSIFNSTSSISLISFSKSISSILILVTKLLVSFVSSIVFFVSSVKNSLTFCIKLPLLVIIVSQEIIFILVSSDIILISSSIILSVSNKFIVVQVFVSISLVSTLF
jgi:hypothetical protein